MKNLVYLLFLGLLTFGVLGYFLNWYQFDDAKNASGHRRLTLDIDANKVLQDVHKGEQKVNESLETYTQQGQPTNQATSSTSDTNQKHLTPPELHPPKQ